MTDKRPRKQARKTAAGRDPASPRKPARKKAPARKDTPAREKAPALVKAATRPESPPPRDAPAPAAGPAPGEGLTDFDLHLFAEGRHWRIWEKLGAHPARQDGREGTRFAVWAPNAGEVSVIGDFNGWDRSRHPLRCRGGSGAWEGFIPDVGRGALYKYFIRSRDGGYQVEKTDPFAFACEIRPATASRVWSLGSYTWGDEEWMASRRARNAHDAPQAVYEVHLGSWRRKADEDGRWLTYREMAPELAGYCRDMGFTHVELLPVSEHPFDGSWGYQTVGYYAPTSRFGDPEDFKALVDTLHRHGVGVILDWVPAHFPTDEHGLGYFDGTHLFEHADPRQGSHPDWGTLIFNYGRNEVKNFLIANALYWLEEFHIDGLRVDAVASMLYLDYSREEGQWLPNKYGGRENLEAIDFLKEFNTVVYDRHPDVMTLAEESTAWPMVSRPTYLGGLGFGFKWNMGWMHDTLEYASKDPIHRGYHHHQMTFGLIYAFQENFVLPLSHDEVVHGKGSLLGKMPGDEWQRFANLRTLYGWMWTHPGKKLLFMGGELGQWQEWSHDRSLDWHLLEQAPHRGLQRWLRDLNTFLRGEPALFQRDFDPEGFHWIDCNDAVQSTFSFLRWDAERQRPLVCVFNFTPVPRPNYRVGVPREGTWQEALNSDAPLYGGSGQGNLGLVDSAPVAAHGHYHSLNITLPPLAAVVFRPMPGA